MKTGKVFEKIKVVLLLTILLLPVFNINAQDIIDLDLLSAREEFKWGVKAYHRGLYNEAARAFEKALAYKPENTEMQEWLGLSWYRSGFTDAAIHIWESIRSIGEADSLLVNRLEILKQQTGVAAERQGAGRYLPAMELKGVQEDFILFINCNILGPQQLSFSPAGFSEHSQIPSIRSASCYTVAVKFCNIKITVAGKL